VAGSLEVTGEHGLRISLDPVDRQECEQQGPTWACSDQIS
jgi:hypothetical protein